MKDLLLDNSWEITDYSSSYILLIYVNMNLASCFSITNLLTYDQHLLEPLLNEYVSMEKIEHLAEVFARTFQANLWLFKDFFMHYVRYQGKSILASKGTFHLMNKWKDYFFNFWKSYFYLWSYPGRAYINQLSNHSLDFLGYHSSVCLKPSMVRGQMLENTFLINNAIKKFDSIVPIMPLVGSLAKSKFCNALGHPIGKAIWADLSNSDIIERFGRIYRNLSHYHSGSSKKKFVLI